MRTAARSAPLRRGDPFIARRPAGFGSDTTPSSTCRATTRGSCRRSQNRRPCGAEPHAQLAVDGQLAQTLERASPGSRGRSAARRRTGCPPASARAMWQTHRLAQRHRLDGESAVPPDQQLVDHHVRRATRASTSLRETPSISPAQPRRPRRAVCSTAAMTCAVPLTSRLLGACAIRTTSPGRQLGAAASPPSDVDRGVGEKARPRQPAPQVGVEMEAAVGVAQEAGRVRGAVAVLDAAVLLRAEALGLRSTSQPWNVTRIVTPARRSSGSSFSTRPAARSVIRLWPKLKWTMS